MLDLRWEGRILIRGTPASKTQSAIRKRAFRGANSPSKRAKTRKAMATNVKLKAKIVTQETIVMRGTAIVSNVPP